MSIVTAMSKIVKLVKSTSWCADHYPLCYRLCIEKRVCKLEKFRTLTCGLKFLGSKLGSVCPLKPLGQFNPKMCSTEFGILSESSLRML